jgi:hypothetical protein
VSTPATSPVVSMAHSASAVTVVGVGTVVHTRTSSICPLNDVSADASVSAPPNVVVAADTEVVSTPAPAPSSSPSTYTVTPLAEAVATTWCQ